MNQDTLGIIFRCSKKYASVFVSLFLLISVASMVIFPFGVEAATCYNNDGTAYTCDSANIDPNSYYNSGGSTQTTGGNNSFYDFSDTNQGNSSGYQGTQGQNDQYTQYFQNTPYAGTAPTNVYTGKTPASNSQAASYINGAPSSGNASSTRTTQAASLASCLGGKAIGNFIKQKIGSVINTDKYKFVSVTSVDTDARAGASNGFPPSWDSIAYCLLNEVIAQITNATIAWINSGFNGNPAFISDPQRFFSDLANYEASQFIQQVAYGATGLNICQPFRVQIATGLNQAYNNGYGSASSCSLGTIGQNLQNFQAYTSGGSGSGNLNNWWNVSQNPQNNPSGAYLLAQQELSRRISMQQNTAIVDLSHGNGFLSYKECAPDTVNDVKGVKTTVKGACHVTTPGKVIEDRVNSVTSAGTNRLVLADKFDQVVDALVNQLIKTALNKVLSQ